MNKLNIELSLEDVNDVIAALTFAYNNGKTSEEFGNFSVLTRLQEIVSGVSSLERGPNREMLNLAIDHLKTENQELRANLNAWMTSGLDLANKYNTLVLNKVHTDQELEYYRINAIESYELKLPVHKNVYIRAIAGLKGSPATQKSETNEVSQQGTEDKEEY